MTIEQIYTGCLAQGAYYIESDGDAVVIDPLREVGPYIKRAHRDGARIRYVFETHFHADFVSGHLDLAYQTGAAIVYGPNARPAFRAYIAADGQTLPLGKVSFKVLHTPGHTMESTCFLLRDENGQDVALFTGDTLLIGDVGRPDLAQKQLAYMTQERMAGLLYDSLRQKILPLADNVILYPAHGAGSACSKHMSIARSDTLGHQKATNFALQAMDRETFINKVTEGLLTPPAYFFRNVQLNSQGYERLDDVWQRGLNGLGPEAFEAAANETGALILDTRDAQVFAHGFIPTSINIALNGDFAPWVGKLLNNVKQPLLIIADAGREQEAVTRLARVGYDFAIGFLQGGLEAWAKSGGALDQIESISARELADRRSKKAALPIIDVRCEGEYASEHIPGAKNIPLEDINDYVNEISRERIYYVHSSSGYRSMIFISIMRARGYRNLVDVQGGLTGIRESGVAVTAGVNQTTSS